MVDPVELACVPSSSYTRGILKGNNGAELQWASAVEILLYGSLAVKKYKLITFTRKLWLIQNDALCSLWLCFFPWKITYQKEKKKSPLPAELTSHMCSSASLQAVCKELFLTLPAQMPGWWAEHWAGRCMKYRRASISWEPCVFSLRLSSLPLLVHCQRRWILKSWCRK